MSEGLPGRLTKRHIEMARERGDNYITYKHITYSLKELEDGAGISRVKPKPKISEDIHSNRTGTGDGKSTEPSGNSRKK